MKILVFGHSNSDGSHLSESKQAWPWVLQRGLASSGIEAEIVHRLFIAGPTGAGYLERQLERERPDVAVVSTSTFGIAVQLVSTRMQERFGERAANAARRAERFAAQHPGTPGTVTARTFLEVRRVGRRLLGTRGTVTASDLVRYYDEAFRTLARAEDVHTIVLLGPGYSRNLHRLNPGSVAAQDEIQMRLGVLAAEHHFDHPSQEEILGGRDGKQHHFQSDGVHLDAAGQAKVGEALLPLVLAKQ